MKVTSIDRTTSAGVSAQPKILSTVHVAIADASGGAIFAQLGFDNGQVTSDKEFTAWTIEF